MEQYNANKSRACFKRLYYTSRELSFLYIMIIIFAFNKFFLYFFFFSTKL